jgi:hypothetical protein
MLLAPNQLGCVVYVRRDLSLLCGGVALLHTRAASAGGGYMRGWVMLGCAECCCSSEVVHALLSACIRVMLVRPYLLGLPWGPFSAPPPGQGHAVWRCCAQQSTSWLQHERGRS